MEDGLTGLETAIVLIAFVVIAAAFSMMVIPAGMTLSDTARTEVHQGVSRAGAGLVVVGTIHAIDLNNDLRYAEIVTIPVKLLPGSDPVDLSQLTVHIIGRNHYGRIKPNDSLFSQIPSGTHYSICHPLRPDQNPILLPDEMVVIAVRPTSVINFKPGDNPKIEIIAPNTHPLLVPLSFPGALTTVTPVG